MKSIIFAGGSAWTLDALLFHTKGVIVTNVGKFKIGSYTSVAFSDNDFLEAVYVEYNENEVSLGELFQVFYFAHTPELVSWSKEDCEFPFSRSAVIVLEADMAHTVKEFLANYNKNTKMFRGNKEDFILDEKHAHYFKKYKKDPYVESIVLPKLIRYKENFSSLYKE